MTLSARERRIWDLLTRNFQWEMPADHAVKVRDRSGELLASARLQIFEVVVTTILARMRPDFVWSVTPNRADDGIDFWGVHRFLEDRDLGISAAITVGGQCKKRTRVNDVVDEIAGSLIKMAGALNPTFFVVAFSARLNRVRVERAQRELERECRRHCHILDRAQIEGLMIEYLDTVADVLREALETREREEVIAYLKARRPAAPPPSITIAAPPRVLAGESFRVQVSGRWTLVSHPAARLWWRQAGDAGTVTVIGPIGADAHSGARLAGQTSGADPLGVSCALELRTYAVGRVNLGELLIGLHDDGPEAAERYPLGHVDIVENMRPRFFERPYRAGLVRLSGAYDRVLTGAAASVGVIGAGGSGKSRLCEEFSLDKRRRGGSVIAVKHLKTHEAPHRILADLLSALAGDERRHGDPAGNVVQAVAHYDGDLADRVAPAIRSLFESRTTSAETTDQSVLSSVLLLIAARCRNQPVIVHLQDLHWCSAEVLSLFERLLRQLTQLLSTPSTAYTESGVLFLFEGRVRESDDPSRDAWSSAPFEAFLQRTDSTLVPCSAFTPDDALTFARLLFEDQDADHRAVADDLLGLQRELVERVYEAAGGNPFHTLEQVRLLKELGVVGQNSRNGLLYLIRADPLAPSLPESVFAAIRLRWQYMRSRAPDLALLVWGCALLEDQLPAPLFRALWSALAPSASLREIDATEILWTGDGTAHQVVFRHENYFESIRRFTVSEADRRRVVETYCDWFAALRRPSAADRFRWARAVLEHPDRNEARARTLLTSALKSSQRSGDPRLTRRILAFHLDLNWDVDERSPLRTDAFLRRCDEEMDLCRDLLTVDREQAARRIGRVRDRIKERLQRSVDSASRQSRGALLRQSLAADVVHAQVLFNDRRPVQSAELAGRVIAGVRAQRETAPADARWESLEMEALYTQSVAQALSGEFPSAVRSSAAAAEIAEHSPSPLARRALSTYGTLLLSEDPRRGELLLRDCIERWPDDDSSDVFLMHVHLSMALVLQAYRCDSASRKRRSLLGEARDRMTQVHDSCRRLGLYPDAGAAALVRGVVSAVAGDSDEASWFAHGVAAAAKGRQMETLWRSHLNLATALYRKEGSVTQSAHDHAVAALDILQDSLSVYAEPERSPRFAMLCIGLAAIAGMLIVAGDPRGTGLLERYPSLCAHFADPQAGLLAPYDGGSRHYQWLRVDDVDYVLY